MLREMLPADRLTTQEIWGGGGHVWVHPISAIFRHVSKTNRRGKWIIGESRGRTKATLEPHPPLPPWPWAKQSRRWPLKEQFVTCQLLRWERMTVWNWQHQMRSVVTAHESSQQQRTMCVYDPTTESCVWWKYLSVCIVPRSQDLRPSHFRLSASANEIYERRQSSGDHTIVNIRFWVSRPSIGAQSGSREPGNCRVGVNNQPF